MEEKFLPIGTVCTTKKSNKKVMIISYFSIEYNNMVTMYDYKGCVYPEGLLLPSQAISFNHDDIVSVDYIGYKNEEFEILNGNLKRKVDTPAVNDDQAIFNNFQFDENGVVIFDPTVPFENVPVSEVNNDIDANSVSNPFQVSQVQQEQVESNDDIFGNIKFDENGVVIEDNTAPLPEESAFKFDENGFVIEDNTAPLNDTVEDEPLIKFDENGIVIEDNTAPLNDAAEDEPLIKFDENGVVIEDNTAPLNDAVEDEPLIKFDENGVVIEDNM